MHALLVIKLRVIIPKATASTKPYSKTMSGSREIFKGQCIYGILFGIKVALLNVLLELRLKFLNQVRAGCKQVDAWFLEIILCGTSVCLCMCVCVSTAEAIIINNLLAGF